MPNEICLVLYPTQAGGLFVSVSVFASHPLCGLQPVKAVASGIRFAPVASKDICMSVIALNGFNIFRNRTYCFSPSYTLFYYFLTHPRDPVVSFGLDLSIYTNTLRLNTRQSNKGMVHSNSQQNSVCRGIAALCAKVKHCFSSHWSLGGVYIQGSSDCFQRWFLSTAD
jgi:hypothetical protein